MTSRDCNERPRRQLVLAVLAMLAIGVVVGRPEPQWGGDYGGGDYGGGDYW